MSALMMRGMTTMALPRRAMSTRGRAATVVVRAGKCACGKTSDPAGNCDGSHAKKMCGCGATASPKGFCDGSHAKPKCGCGKTKDAKGFCDGSHAK